MGTWWVGGTGDVAVLYVFELLICLEGFCNCNLRRTFASLLNFVLELIRFFSAYMLCFVISLDQFLQYITHLQTWNPQDIKLLYIS